jgi:hypothetical protein
MQLLYPLNSQVPDSNIDDNSSSSMLMEESPQIPVILKSSLYLILGDSSTNWNIFSQINLVVISILLSISPWIFKKTTSKYDHCQKILVEKPQYYREYNHWENFEWI